MQQTAADCRLSLCQIPTTNTQSGPLTYHMQAHGTESRVHYENISSSVFVLAVIFLHILFWPKDS